MTYRTGRSASFFNAATMAEVWDPLLVSTSNKPSAPTSTAMLPPSNLRVSVSSM